MNISRSGYYKWLKTKDILNRYEINRRDLEPLIRDIHKRKPSYGYHKINAVIFKETRWIVSDNLVHKICKILKIRSKDRHYSIYKKPDEEYLNELIETLNLKSRVNHLPNELSGGQQQRVSIGRALMNRPSILLADEPTGNLDSKASREIIDLLKLSNEKYKQTIIMITHDHNLALSADRIITIEDGKIISDEKVK